MIPPTLAYCPLRRPWSLVGLLPATRKLDAEMISDLLTGSGGESVSRSGRKRTTVERKDEEHVMSSTGSRALILHDFRLWCVHWFDFKSSLIHAALQEQDFSINRFSAVITGLGGISRPRKLVQECYSSQQFWITSQKISPSPSWLSLFVNLSFPGLPSSESGVIYKVVLRRVVSQVLPKEPPGASLAEKNTISQADGVVQASCETALCSATASITELYIQSLSRIILSR